MRSPVCGVRSAPATDGACPEQCARTIKTPLPHESAGESTDSHFQSGGPVRHYVRRLFPSDAANLTVKLFPSHHAPMRPDLGQIIDCLANRRGGGEIIHLSPHTAGIIEHVLRESFAAPGKKEPGPPVGGLV